MRFAGGRESGVVELNPLCMIAVTEAGNEATALAINEVSLLRQLNQAAHIRILINGKAKGDELVCDGVLGATAAGLLAFIVLSMSIVVWHMARINR